MENANIFISLNNLDSVRIEKRAPKDAPDEYYGLKGDTHKIGIIARRSYVPTIFGDAGSEIDVACPISADTITDAVAPDGDGEVDIGEGAIVDNEVGFSVGPFVITMAIGGLAVQFAGKIVAVE